MSTQLRGQEQAVEAKNKQTNNLFIYFILKINK